MSDWSESWLRDAAGWRAVKEGRALFAAGRVEQAAVEGDTCRGAIRESKGLRRIVVRQVSRHDVEARCGCPENRATGALCAHAVAVVLAAIRQPAISTPAPAAPQPATATDQTPAVPLQVGFSPRWPEELSRGRLNVKVSQADAREATEGDRTLGTWLAVRRVLPGASPRMLQLAADDLGEFLALLCRHEPVTTADGPLRLSEGNARCLVESSAPVAGLLTLRREQASGESPLTPVGRSWVQWQPATRTLHLGGPTPAGWDESLWRSLCEGRPVQVPLALALGSLESTEPPFEAAPDSWLADCRVVAVRPGFELHLDGTSQRATASLSARYPDQTIVQIAGQGSHRILRVDGLTVETTDPAAETAAAQTLITAGFTAGDPPGCFRIADEETVTEFATATLPALRRQWQVSESPAWLATHRQLKSVRPSFVPTGSGEDWFAFDLRLVTEDGVVIPPAAAARLLRSKGRSLETKDGNRLCLSREDADWLDGTLEDMNLSLEAGAWKADIGHQPHFLSIQQNAKNKLISNELRITQTTASNADVRVRLGALAERLRDYQLAGVTWLAERLQDLGGALLADDMGLGKTIQTLAWIKISLAGRGDLGPVLVVCPTSLVGNWRDEAMRFTPELRVTVLHGSGRDERFEQLAEVDLALTTYGSLVRDRALHLRREYAAVVLDEASVIRNPDAEVSRCVAKLRARARLALTGTPVENRLGDLWAMFRFLRPGYLGSRERFREVFEIPCAQGAPPISVRRRLADRVGPFLLRRTKSEVAKDLPPKLEIIDWCEMSAVQRGWYAGLVREGARVAEECRNQPASGGARLKVLTALLRLRQVCCDLRLLATDDPAASRWTPDERSGKLARLLERVREAVDGGHRILVFSQFATMLGHLREALEAEQFGCCLLDGSTRDRAAEIARFRAADGPPVFLISLKAGGYGLNLQEADTVIHYDPWWNPAAEAQASDRAHRIGQTRPVTVYKLLTRGTVEEKVLKLQERKRAILDATLAAVEEDGGGLPTGLGQEELLGLLDT